MNAIKMSDGIYRVGVNIDEKDYLFEGMWPVPGGVSLNSFIVLGEKKAIIDLVHDEDIAIKQIINQINSISLEIKDFDYLIMNHIEPDHSGWLKKFIKANPDIKIVTTEKGAKNINVFYDIHENIQIVKSGDAIELGNNKTLVFEEIPNVHWPDTMVTYETSSQTLFSCDAFGSYGNLTDSIFDDQISEEEHKIFDKESLRYYANIVASFSPAVERAIKKLENLELKTIAPSHGIIWRENPKEIVDRYQKFASYLTGSAEKEITIIWGSMYGNTKKVLNAIIEGIRSEKIPVHLHQLPNENISFALASAWKSKGLIFGMPTYEYKMFPPIANAIDMFSRKHVWNRTVFRFGSYGWSGGAQKEFEQITENLKWNFIDPVEWAGQASDEDLKEAFNRGQQLARLIKKDN